MEDNDFGFTIEDEKSPQIDKAAEMYAAVGPLLMNLAKDPQKDIIKWPGEQRVKQMSELLTKIQKILGEADRG